MNTKKYNNLKNSSNESSKESIKELPTQESFRSIFLYGNIRLIFPLITFIFFNYLKMYYFTGYTIELFYFFHMFMILSYIYYINFNSIHNKSNNKSNSNSVMYSSRYALILLFLINIFMNINPYKKNLSFVKSNILFTILLLVFFNLINFICNFN